MNVIIAQLISVIAIYLSCKSFCVEDNKDYLIYRVIINLIVMLQYTLLSAWAGAVISLIISIKYAVFYGYERYDKKVHTLVLLLLIMSMILTGMFTYSSWVDELPIIATIITTIAMWKSSMRGIRYSNLATLPLWLVYDFVTMSYIQCVSDIVQFAVCFSAERDMDKGLSKLVVSLGKRR